jgi:CheY-like chemotaxis protein
MLTHETKTPLTVLIVDDHDMFRRGLQRLVTIEGCHVVAYESAEQAAVATRGCFFDIALLDLHLPGIFGDEFAVLLRARGAYKRIAFVTSDLHCEDRLRAKFPGSQVIPKPICIATLLRLLRTSVH